MLARTRKRTRSLRRRSSPAMTCLIGKEAAFAGGACKDCGVCFTGVAIVLPFAGEPGALYGTLKLSNFKVRHPRNPGHALGFQFPCPIRQLLAFPSRRLWPRLSFAWRDS